MCQIPARTFAKKSKESNRNDKKRAQEKEQIYEEFEGQDLDTVKSDFTDALEMCQDVLEESLASIKSGRASPTIFNDILVKAYGEEYPLGDLATTVV